MGLGRLFSILFIMCSGMVMCQVGMRMLSICPGLILTILGMGCSWLCSVMSLWGRLRFGLMGRRVRRMLLGSRGGIRRVLRRRSFGCTFVLSIGGTGLRALSSAWLATLSALCPVMMPFICTRTPPSKVLNRSGAASRNKSTMAVRTPATAQQYTSKSRCPNPSVRVSNAHDPRVQRPEPACSTFATRELWVRRFVGVLVLVSPRGFGGFRLFLLGGVPVLRLCRSSVPLVSVRRRRRVAIRGTIATVLGFLGFVVWAQWVFWF